MSVLLGAGGDDLFEALKNFNGDGKDKSVVGAIGGIFDSLKGAKGDGTRFGEAFHSFVEVFGGGEFTLGADDGSSAFALGFGLFGHDPFHVVGDGDVLKFDAGNVNAPINGFFVDNTFDFVTDFFAVGEKGIKLDTTDDIAESSLGILGNGIGEVADFEDGIFGLGNLEVDHGVDGNSNIVASNNFLFGNINSIDADVDFDNPLKNGDD